MISLLTAGLRIAGVGLLLLALLHIPIGRHLGWREERTRMTAANGAIFHVHMVFICLVLVAMALPCLLDPRALLERSRAALWGTWMLSAFWSFRLYCQWCIYPRSLWQGKKLETMIHWIFSAVWTSLALLFGLCGLVQVGWIR